LCLNGTDAILPVVGEITPTKRILLNQIVNVQRSVIWNQNSTPLLGINV